MFLLPPLIATVLKGLFFLNRHERRGSEHLEAVLEEHGHAIFAFWHESMHLAGCSFRGQNYHTLTSYSFDGELAARTINWIGGLEAVRGSSSRGGGEGLRQLEKAVEMVPCVGFTLDGPRGPRRVAKAGIAVLSARTGIPIVPLALVATRIRRLHSWDRLPVPLPFGRIICATGSPVPPPPDTSPESVENTRLSVEIRLNQLHEEIEKEFHVPYEAE